MQTPKTTMHLSTFKTVSGIFNWGRLTDLQREYYGNEEWNDYGMKNEMIMERRMKWLW